MKIRRTVIVWIGTLAVVMLALRMSGCQGTPTPELSPIAVAGLEEVPNVIGYMAFSVTEEITGTVYITRELRQSGQVLAIQNDAVPISTSGINTDTILSPFECPLWGVVLNETAEMWTKASLVYKALRGTVTMQIDGVGYADLDTPLLEVDGFYMMHRIEVHKMYLPLIFK